MTAEVEAQFRALLRSAALLGGLGYGYLAYMANADIERAVWKGFGAFVVLMLVERGALWVLRPWTDKPLEGDVLPPSEDGVLENGNDSERKEGEQ